MARIEGRDPKEISGGYERLFGDPDLGLLMSKVQGTVISSGSELERMIVDRVRTIEDLDVFLRDETMPDGVFIAPKRQVKACRSLDFPEGEPDFLIFKRRDGRQLCHVVELKDGHVFDTKKASAEHAAIHAFIESNAAKLQYRVLCHFVAFNQNDRDVIVAGFKNRISRDEAITGREFCELLEIDYDEIVERRQADQESNLRYFIRELAGIDRVAGEFRRLLEEERGTGGPRAETRGRMAEPGSG